MHPIEPLEPRTLFAPATLDPTFGVAGEARHSVEVDVNEQANAAVLQPDGKLLVCGGGADGFQVDMAVQRFDADGSVDATFGVCGQVRLAARDAAAAIALQADGKILLA